MSALDVGAILDELVKDRRSQLGVFTTTMNLVVFCDDASATELIAERTAAIAEKHPCRLLFLDSTRARERHGVQSARSERVDVGVADMGVDELRSIVHALLVPNVPTTMLWTAHHTYADVRFAALGEYAHAALVDSSRLDQTGNPLRELAQYVGFKPDAVVRDLAYMRLLPWQDMIAQFFDDAELAEDLCDISDVEVACGSDCESYYLVGWLGSRLGWKPCGQDAFCNRGGDRISVAIQRSGTPRRVKRVALRSNRATYLAELEREAGDVACLRVEGTLERPQRCAPLHGVEVVTLIERAILAQSADATYAESLETARALLEWQKGTLST